MVGFSFFYRFGDCYTVVCGAPCIAKLLYNFKLQRAPGGTRGWEAQEGGSVVDGLSMLISMQLASEVAETAQHMG